MENNDIIGALVLVNPELESDPAKQQGQIGVIQYADIGKDEMYVGFPGGREGIYASDALFTLKNKTELFSDMMKDTSGMEPENFKDLYKIALLQDRGTNRGLIEAMEIAKNNPAIWPDSLVKVEELLGQRQAKAYSR